EALAGRVRLRLAHAWALAFSIRLAEATATLKAIDHDIEAGRLALDDRSRCEMLAVRAAVAGLADDRVEAERLGNEVMGLRPAPQSWIDQIAQTTVLFGHIFAGRLDALKELQVRAKAFPVNDRPVYSHVFVQCMFALAAILQGRLHEARQVLAEVLD